MSKRILLTALVLLLSQALPVLALDPAKSLSQYSLSSWREASGLPHDGVQGLAQTPHPECAEKLYPEQARRRRSPMGG